MPVEVKDLLIIFLSSLVGGFLLSRVAHGRLGDWFKSKKEAKKDDILGAEEV